ncbi:FtsX-like permease family protein [Isoptericola sp. BMS4]|uniref:FtsX-like permease family protein n=1 Tax=Isoptericola sp. BMS4 TaxID=2527875 RepID=UPI001421E4E6|nr:FtsX-like permease family protein [Isoptericola sp. BMS4]
MSAVVTLGLRLARAGGPLRAWSIAAGNAVGVVLLVVALALLVAAYPDPVARAQARVQLLGIDLFLLLPAVVLLVTVGRLSSGVRDRRLAALRMIGVTPARTRTVAAVENGALALAGATAGAVVAALGAPAASAAAVAAGWLAQPLQVTWGSAAAVVATVAVLSMVVGTGASWNRELPGRARSESAPRTPQPGRLAVLGLGLALLWWASRAGPYAGDGVPPEPLLLGGGVLAAVGIAVATPLMTAWSARWLVRSRGTAAVLAGRAVETDPAGASRVVAGLGVAVFLAAGALGVVAAFESTPQYRYTLQSLEAGPQKIHAMARTASGDEKAFDPAALRALDTVPGVQGVVTARTASTPCDPEADISGCASIFVGTCADLSLVLEQSGCDDAHAAWITHDGGYGDVAPPPSERDLTAPIVATAEDGGPPEPQRSFEPGSAPIVVDARAQVDRWVYPEGYVAFVPEALADDLVGPPTSAEVVADGGVEVQEAVVAWADEHGYVAFPYPTDDVEYVAEVRAAVFSLAGVSLAVGLLVLALTAADRAVERRRTVARQLVVGVPGRVLRAGQLVQVLVPTVAAAVLGVGSGCLLVVAYTRLAEMAGPESVTVERWAMLAGVLGVGGLLVALATLPLTRVRLTPELLRRE